MALTIPQFEDYLRSLGVGEANESGSRYITDGQGEQQRLSQGMLDEMMGNDLTSYQQAQIAQQGYVPLEPLNDVSWMNQNYGTNFGGGADYANWLYGGGQVETGPDGKQYFKTPNGTTAYVNQPLKYIAPDDPLGSLVKMGIIGLATAGLGGYLPGTESIFGGAAAGAGGAAGAGAAEGALALGAEAAAPAFVGGASGAGVAGAGLGGTLSGLTTAELAALGIGGVGAASGATGAGGAFNFADYINSGVLPGGGTSAVPAIPGMGNGVGLTEAALAGLKSGGSSLLSGLLGGSGETDWAQILGALGGAGLGMAGANAQGDAYSDVADKYLALGAPYRQKLEASYAPGFSMADQPDFMNALDIGAQAAARATSAKVGNPVDNPGAYSEMQKYISGSLALPQLNTYRSQLGSFGQLGTNTAGTNDTAAAGQTSGMYNAAGYGLGQLTQPKNPYEDAMKGLLGQFGKLNQPGFLA